MAIARNPMTVIDCPDPQGLAQFYGAMLGWSAEPDSDEGWVTISNGGGRELSFQRVDDYRAPDWPGQQVPQQLHIDVDVDDLDEAEAAVLELGATKHDQQPGQTFRVFLDPAGHPFCLVKPSAL
ncbi:hypothetical protein SAMN04487783_1487 [Agrococcus baldri]|uniref:Glyoxalase-like domain-containing protein n=1 Tax=Agrococcus baldri TaxID=153730 RepID=A0AA94HMF8_9MICO|nr:VOC family protein [Agrococcus baldri]SFS10943.1 hypothetical protein SAMN04487783_1487 [Agrococcus baldri]